MLFKLSNFLGVPQEEVESLSTELLGQWILQTDIHPEYFKERELETLLRPF